MRRDCGWSMSVAGRWINCRCDIALLLSELRVVRVLYHSVLSVGFPVFSDGLRIRPIPAWLIPAIVKRSKDAYLGFSITQRNTFLFPHIIYILCRFHLYIEPFLFIYWIFLIYILSLFHLYIKSFSFICRTVSVTSSRQTGIRRTAVISQTSLPAVLHAGRFSDSDRQSCAFPQSCGQSTAVVYGGMLVLITLLIIHKTVKLY